MLSTIRKLLRFVKRFNQSFSARIDKFYLSKLRPTATAQETKTKPAASNYADSISLYAYIFCPSRFRYIAQTSFSEVAAITRVYWSQH